MMVPAGPMNMVGAVLAIIIEALTGVIVRLVNDSVGGMEANIIELVPGVNDKLTIKSVGAVLASIIVALTGLTMTSPPADTLGG